jgi:glycosyltransferase involved in cell wall biosynthesis
VPARKGPSRHDDGRAAQVDELRVQVGSAVQSVLTRDGASESRLVGLDATLLASGHAIRGIGRYLQGVTEALLREEPQWCLDHLGLLLVKGQTWPASTGWSARMVWTRHSPRFRPQDVGWAWAAIADRAALGRRRPALWHQTDPGAPVSPLPMQLTITTSYDLIPLHEPEVMARIRAHRRIVYKLYLRNLRRARIVVAISETTADDLVETLRIPRDRIRVVYPVVESLAGRGQGPASAGVAGATPDDAGPRFLFVGIPDPHKRPDLAVAAFARFRAAHHDGRLTFAGYQPHAVRQRLRDQSEALGVAGAVDYVDRVDDRTLAAMYASAVLLSLSRREGFGLPPVEALLTGGQAVAVPGTIYDEVLGDACIRAESDDPDAIARAMLVACDSRPDSVALERLQARYSPRAASAALRAVYDEALGQIEARAHAL